MLPQLKKKNNLLSRFASCEARFENQIYFFVQSLYS